jgi:hypothetical protein
LIAGLASTLNLSREMGALIAGVAISTFPYNLDVTAKVTSLRDFFITLFFVSLGTAIPAPSRSLVLGALLLSGWVILSRLITVLPLLYRLRLGHRASLLVTVHLSQISEFSLVIVALGLKAQHIGERTAGLVSYAFVFLAVISTYAITRSNALVRWLSPVLAKAGFPDLGESGASPAQTSAPPTLFLLGFSWAASSLLEEIERRDPDLLAHLVVLDFNPQVYETLKTRGVRVIYGDISQRDTLLHAGVDKAQIIVSTLPNTVLKGADNLRLLHQLRELNPQAQIMVHAELLSEVPKLYAAGASYVTVPRLLEAIELLDAIRAARSQLLSGKRAALDRELALRNEVIP